MNEDLKQLRAKIDGNDPFMNQGHEIKIVRTRERVVPDWALSNEQTAMFLETAFPKLRDDRRQRDQAGRWARVIQLYFRMKMPHNQVSEELTVPYKTLRSLIRNIKRAGTAFNSGKLRPRGRPKLENDATYPPSLEGDIKQGPNEALTSTSLHRTDQGSRGDSRASSAQEVSLQEESHR